MGLPRVIVAGFSAFLLTNSSATFGEKSIFDDPALWGTPLATTRPSKPGGPSTPTPAPANPPAVPSPTTPANPVTPVGPTPTIPAPSTPAIPKPVPHPPAPKPGTPPNTPNTTPSAPVTPPIPPKPTEPDPEPVYAGIYHAEIARVETSKLTKDDGEFAQKLLQAAKLATDSPRLQRLLYEKAADYGSRDPASARITLAAITALRSVAGDRTDLDDRMLAVAEKQFRMTSTVDRQAVADGYRRALHRVAELKTAAGQYNEAIALAKKAGDAARSLGPDEATESANLLKQIVERSRLDRRASDLVARVRTPEGATDRSAVVESVSLLAGILPRASEALFQLDKVPDEQLEYAIRLSLASHDKVNSTQAAWAAEWYRRAADTAPAGLQAPLYRVACGWYAHYFAIHLPVDEERVRMLLGAQMAAGRLTKLDPRDERPYAFDFPGHSVPMLLAAGNVERHRVTGTWKTTTNGTLGESTDTALGRSTGLLCLPVSPGTSYEVSLQYASEGASTVGIVLPAIAGSSFAIVRSGTDCKLTLADGGARTLSGPFPDPAKDGGRHTIYVRVVNKFPSVGIIVGIDGVEAGRWEGKPSGLGLPTDLPALPDRMASGLFVQGGRAIFMDVSSHSLAERPRLLDIPGQTELPPDGSRPRDAVVTRPTPTTASYYHNGATIIFDSALSGGLSVAVPEPHEDLRILRAGMTALLANPANLAPLRTELYPRYKRLLGLNQTAPRASSDADNLKLLQFWRAHELAKTDDDRARAESGLFMTIHGVADRYRKAAVAWGKQVQQNTSDEELHLIGKFGKPTP